MHVVREFGPEVLSSDGCIDRKKLGEIVFNDHAKRGKLNKIMQPHIALGIFLLLLRHFLRGTPVVILVVPLLYETGLHRVCAAVLVVSVARDVQLRRLMKRDQSSEEDAFARIRAQPLTVDQKAARELNA